MSGLNLDNRRDRLKWLQGAVHDLMAKAISFSAVWPARYADEPFMKRYDAINKQIRELYSDLEGQL